MYRKYIKRLMDIVISALGIIILSPIYLIVGVIVWIGIGRPVLFSQMRVGKGEKPFKLYKFRSMTNETDENGDLLDEHLRLTKIGVVLRTLSIDELPELVCVFLGHMSLVGPRPLPVYYSPYYLKEERKRHLVRGGLIPPDGLSQKTIPEWEEQFAYDIDYVEKCSFLLDVKIIFTTFKILFKRTETNYGAERRLHLNEYRTIAAENQLQTIGK